MFMKNYTYSLLQTSLLCLFLITSCGKPNGKIGVPVDDLHIQVADVKTDTSNFSPLAWESKNKDAKDWSKMVYSVIENEEPAMMGQNVADDTEVFCPKYKSLTDAERLNFWGQFFAALAKPESDWNPLSQYVESTQGIDPVTQQRVMSEGLLQLSYQDEKSYHLDCGFDWNRDKNLDLKDPRKTILNPYLNLRCGIKIMALQLKNRRSIRLDKNVYWAVLKIGGRNNNIAKISAMTKSLKICQ
jgi:hypothetical protein